MSGNGNHLIFVPDKFVPISEYVRIDDCSEAARINVRPELLKALAGNGSKVQAAFYRNKTLEYSDILSIDEDNGFVSITPKEVGIYAIVTDELQNAYPIVTNWNASLNGGRGGPQSGGTDGIGVLRLNAVTGEREVDLPIRDSDTSNPFYYRTDAFALFAGEEDGELLRTPAYERYIGETYSVVSVTEEVALKLSGETLKLTGYPVIIRSSEEKLERLEGVPAFQLVHGHIVGQGEHRSMVSYILPPFWSRTPKSLYPAIFSGFYDQNENVFANVGPPILKVLGQTLLETGRGVVGIIWNGGGSFGTRTMHGSIYDNLDDLFRTSVERYAVNAHEIVTVGGSRGGITSLLAAGNPNSTVYSVRYAICYNVPLAFGEPIKEMVNPTCPVYMRAICEDIGYKDAWQQDWRDPEGQSAVDLFLKTLLGTSNSELIANELSPASDLILRALKSKGTQVWWTHGTHDAFTSSWLSFEWVDRARKYGLQVKHEIGYRFGHNNCTNPFDSAQTCLKSILNGEQSVMEGTWHYRRASEAPEKWEQAELFEPVQQPVFLEGPKVAIKGLPILFVMYGEPGMEFRLTLHRTSEFEPKDSFVLMEGTLEQLEGYRKSFSFMKTVQLVPDELIPGTYVYDLQFRRSGAAQWEKTAILPTHPSYKGSATMEVVSEIPNLSSDEWLEKTSQYAIGWGLSEV